MDIDKITQNDTEKSVERHTFAHQKKEVQAGYLYSPNFKDLYLYL